MRRAAHVLVGTAAVVCLVVPTAAATPIPNGDAAVVSGRPLSRPWLDRWLRIAATAQVAQAPGKAVVTPTDPPGFGHCIAAERRDNRALSHVSRSELKRTCGQLFEALVSDVLPFLIRSRWYEDRAAELGISVSQSRALAKYREEKRRQFMKRREFRLFLLETGQTLSDILFRFRLSLIYEALLKKAHGNQASLDRQVRAEFRPRTECARYYVVPECRNS